MSLRRWSMAVASLGLAVVVPAAPGADAHVWRSGLTGCHDVNSADSATHTYWYNSGLSVDMQLATNYARQYSLDPTDLTTVYASSLASDTDVVVYDQDYSTRCGFVWHPNVDEDGWSTWALSQCVSLATNPANACEKNEVRYDESWTTTVGVWDRIAMACHENGHTLGLEHVGTTANSCMVPTVVGSKSAFSSADVGWINTHY